jgi:ketosteroid isomerase-like protein
MPQDNLELVRRFYEFWPDRDFGVIEPFVDPEAVIDVSRNVFNPGTHRGIDGLRRFLEQIDEVWEDFQITPEELIDGGDTVVVAHRISGKGRGSGVHAEVLRFGVITFRDGKVLRFTGGLEDRAEALEVAGISE